MKLALGILHEDLKGLLTILASIIESWSAYPVMGYTHLQSAQPTTMGYRMALYAQDLLQDADNINRLANGIKGKGIKGAVGNYGDMVRLGLSVEQARKISKAVMHDITIGEYTTSSQTYTRKQDLEIGHALSGIAFSLNKMAVDLRLLLSSPFADLILASTLQQVGSSAMPHKVNPIELENVCSLARWVEGQVGVLWGNSHSMLERTLDDSANRRIILPEVFLAIDHMLITMASALKKVNLKSNITSMIDKLALSNMGSLLNKLVERGHDRAKTHDILSILSYMHEGRSLTEQVMLKFQDEMTEREMMDILHTINTGASYTLAMEMYSEVLQYLSTH
jgi:adenylosuccinate lyase